MGRIGLNEVSISPDGTRFAKLQTDKINKMSLLINGQPAEQYYRIAKTIRFSPDGKRIAFAAADDDRTWFIVVDGARGSSFESIDESSIQFSADSQVIAYIATKQKSQYAVVGAQTIGPYGTIKHLTISNDGMRAAYVAQNHAFRVMEIFLSRQLLGSWDNVDQLVLSPDASQVALRGKTAGHAAVGLLGAEPTTYGFAAGEIFFVPGSRRLVSIPVRGRGGVIALDGNVLRTLTGGFESISLSPGAATISFTASGQSEVLKSDGLSIDPQRRAYFSPDGTRTVYTNPSAIDQAIIINLGDANIHSNHHSPPIFSKTNKVALIGYTKENQPRVYLEQNEVAKADEVREASLIFMADGEHVAFAAKRGAKWVAMIDDKPASEAFDDFPDRPFMLDAAGGVHFVAFRGGEAFLCTAVEKK